MNTTLYLLAAFGGILPGVFLVLKSLDNDIIPDVLKSKAFWFSNLIKSGLGVFTLFLVGSYFVDFENQLNPRILATTCGFAGTEILSTVLKLATKLLSAIGGDSSPAPRRILGSASDSKKEFSVVDFL